MEANDLTLSVKGWMGESALIPTHDPSGLAAWIFLKLHGGDSDTTNGHHLKMDETIGLDWLNDFFVVDALVGERVARFQIEKEQLYPRLEQLKNSVIANQDAQGFDDLFHRLSTNLGNNAYLYTTDDLECCCISSIDASFLALAIIIDVNSASLGGLHALLHKRKNLSAYVDKVYSKCTSIPVIDFSDQLVDIKVIGEFISMICEPGASVSELGHGSFGAVHRCTIKVDNAFRLPTGECALKIFYAPNGHFSEMFLARMLNHRSFPRLIGVGEGAHFSCIIMELVNGRDAEQFQKKKRPGEEERVPNLEVGRMQSTLFMLMDIAYGLHILQTSSRFHLAHNDLAPRNVLIDDVRGALILDFGKLCIVDKDGSEDRKRDMLGYGCVAMGILSGENSDIRSNLVTAYVGCRDELKAMIIANWGWTEEKAEQLTQLPLQCVDQKHINCIPYPLVVWEDLRNLMEG